MGKTKVIQQSWKCDQNPQLGGNTGNVYPNMNIFFVGDAKTSGVVLLPIPAGSLYCFEQFESGNSFLSLQGRPFNWFQWICHSILQLIVAFGESYSTWASSWSCVNCILHYTIAGPASSLNLMHNDNHHTGFPKHPRGYETTFARLGPCPGWT